MLSFRSHQRQDGYFYVTVNKWNLNCWLTQKKKDKIFSSYIHITERVCFCYPKLSTEPHIAHSYFEAIFWLQFSPYAASYGKKKLKFAVVVVSFENNFSVVGVRCLRGGKVEDKVTRCYLTLLLDKNFIFTFFIPFHFLLTRKFSFAVGLISFFLSKFPEVKLIFGCYFLFFGGKSEILTINHRIVLFTFILCNSDRKIANSWDNRNSFLSQ